MRFVLLATLFFATSSWGATSPLFSQDGNTATFLLAGMPGDPDPVGLWNALAIPAEEFQGKLSKKVELLDAQGAKVFNIACIFSKVIEGNGSCTVILRKTSGLVDISSGRASLWLRGERALQFANFFRMRAESTIIFRSQNVRLNFSVARDGGVVTDFVVDWR